MLSLKMSPLVNPLLQSIDICLCGNFKRIMLFNNSAKVKENGSPNIDYAAEKAALRRVDWHVLPMFFLYYMFSFLDR